MMGPPSCAPIRKMLSTSAAVVMPKASRSSFRLFPCIAPFEKYPSSVPRNVLPPLFGIAFSDVLPEPDSAPMPVVSSCSS